MKLTRTVLAILIASSLLVLPAQAGWKTRILKGAAIGVGGYLIGKAAAQAAEATAPREELPRDTGVLAIGIDLAKSAIELSQNQFSTEACRATEQIAKNFYADPGAIGAHVGMSFAASHYSCCVANQKLLPEVVALAAGADSLRDLPTNDLVDLALAFGSATYSNLPMDTFRQVLENKKAAVNACVDVAKAHRSLQ